MTTEKYKQVADLIEDAFKGFEDACSVPDPDGGTYRDVRGELHAALQVHAAQAIATLALASEVRAVGLLLTASMGDVRAAPELVRDAFTAAAIHLDLVEPEPDTSREDALRDAGLYPAGQDPADDEGDLK